MRYWWVNQNQTYKYEVPGGFMWSPFKNANGARKPFYDNMDKVQPGDLIFAYAHTTFVLKAKPKKLQDWSAKLLDYWLQLKLIWDPNIWLKLKYATKCQEC